jgi:hypothetical protein
MKAAVAGVDFSYFLERQSQEVKNTSSQIELYLFDTGSLAGISIGQ